MVRLFLLQRTALSFNATFFSFPPRLLSASSINKVRLILIKSNDKVWTFDSIIQWRAENIISFETFTHETNRNITLPSRFQHRFCLFEVQTGTSFNSSSLLASEGRMCTIIYLEATYIQMDGNINSPFFVTTFFKFALVKKQTILLHLLLQC